MYLDCVVDVPDIPGKITHQKKKNAVYIDFEYERIYYPERKYTIPKRVTIGKLDPDNPVIIPDLESHPFRWFRATHSAGESQRSEGGATP